VAVISDAHWWRRWCQARRFPPALRRRVHAKVVHLLPPSSQYMITFGEIALYSHSMLFNVRDDRSSVMRYSTNHLFSEQKMQNPNFSNDTMSFNVCSKTQLVYPHVCALLRKVVGATTLRFFFLSPPVGMFSHTG
jgi:hypothetical protein